MSAPDAILNYRIYGQDGQLIDMTCKDTPSLRRFTEWVRIHDRYTVHDHTLPKPPVQP